MSENIQINNHLEKIDDDLIPFPRDFAKCVANILTSVDDKEEARPISDAGKKFISSIGAILK